MLIRTTVLALTKQSKQETSPYCAILGRPIYKRPTRPHSLKSFLPICATGTSTSLPPPLWRRRSANHLQLRHKICCGSLGFSQPNHCKSNSRCCFSPSTTDGGCSAWQSMLCLHPRHPQQWLRRPRQPRRSPLQPWCHRPQNLRRHPNRRRPRKANSPRSVAASQWPQLQLQGLN